MVASRVLMLLAVLISMVGLAACVEPPRREPVTAADNTAPDYIIGPGDTLGIFVYRSPELSADLPVRPDGRISLPLVPDIEAAGKTPTQLASDIKERLREYVLDPVVTVMVRSFVGPTTRQIRVIGEASQPKAIPYREGMTILDVMIEVGGLTRFAAGNRAELIRRGSEGGAPQSFRVRLADLLRGSDISQDIPMRPGDTLIIPQSWF